MASLPDKTHRSGTQPQQAIALEELRYGVDGKEILSGLTLVTDAQRVGIVGRNGSGKSTLARLLAGLITPTGGTLRLKGQDPTEDRKFALAEIGILFQNPDHQIIFPTVSEEIGFGLRQQGNSRRAAEAQAHAVLDQFGKSHWADVSISTLSQGQKHLVCLMAVVAMDPGMIVLDEPFSGLDIPTKLQLARALSRFKGRIVHISHDPDDLRSYDLVVWLERGQIVQSGRSEDVLTAYEVEMTRLGGLDDLSDLSG